MMDIPTAEGCEKMESGNVLSGGEAEPFVQQAADAKLLLAKNGSDKAYQKGAAQTGVGIPHPPQPLG
jgi:hypothetical protein